MNVQNHRKRILKYRTFDIAWNTKSNYKEILSPSYCSCATYFLPRRCLYSRHKFGLNFFEFKKTDLEAKRLALSARNTLSKNCVITCKIGAPERKFFLTARDGYNDCRVETELYYGRLLVIQLKHFNVWFSQQFCLNISALWYLIPWARTLRKGLQRIEVHHMLSCFNCLESSICWHQLENFIFQDLPF